MTKIKASLTIPNLISAMKEAGFATKTDVHDIVEEVVFEKITEFHANVTKPEMQQMEGRLSKRIEGVETRVGDLDSKFVSLEIKVDGLKDDINGLKAEFARTPSRSEFEKLKTSFNA